VYLVANHKPSAGGINPALFRRTGPECRRNFIWNDATQIFDEIPMVNDNFISLLDLLNCDNAVLRDPEISVIDKERLINISTGNILTKIPGIRWHTIDKLYTFSLDESETIRRLTVSHDEAGDRERREYIETLDTINNYILTHPETFPINLSAFVNNCTEVMFFSNGAYNYKYNLVTTDNTHKATVAYIGRIDRESAGRTLKKLQDLFERNDQSRKLVIVWYKSDATTIMPLCEPLRPAVFDDTTYESNSILK